MQNSSGSSTITATVPAEIIKESRIQPVWHVIVLNVLTLCFYAPVWCYKNSKDLSNRLKFSSDSISSDAGPSAGKTLTKDRKSEKKEGKQKAKKDAGSKVGGNLALKTENADSSTLEGSTGSMDVTASGARAGLQPVRVCVRDSSYDTLAPLSSREKELLDPVQRVPALFLVMGMALPGINFLLGIYFFKMLANLYPDASSLPRKQPLLTAIFLSTLLIGGLCVCKLPDPYYLLYAPAVSIPLAIAQHWINGYWQNVELDKDLLVRHSFSTLELVMLIGGILLLGLCLAHFYIIPKS